ncbi:hypothetical protein Hamer_G020889 [Homarus americanus]|uniref:Uncharacterized protein n=1 Tax=Homarus americanus TaxID=6706 RepID=A0A8J5JWX8_HOMAM|nr:hypothetical protein Hamer_G020889 [Homarus americanus]
MAPKVWGDRDQGPGGPGMGQGYMCGRGGRTELCEMYGRVWAGILLDLDGCSRDDGVWG